jgi:hypothetical protein
MADVGKGRGCALSKERAFLALQCIVRKEETKVVKRLANSDHLVFLWGDCRGDCPFVGITFFTFVLHTIFTSEIYILKEVKNILLPLSINSQSILPPCKYQIYPKPLSTFANPPIHPMLSKQPTHPPMPPYTKRTPIPPAHPFCNQPLSLLSIRVVMAEPMKVQPL